MWYVVQVASGKEQATLERIQKFVDGSTLKEVFIPRRKVIRKRCGGRVLCFRGSVSWIRFRGNRKSSRAVFGIKVRAGVYSHVGLWK